MRIFLITASIMLAIITSACSSDMKDAYRPSGQNYPQIIQGSDYETIKAIEALYAEIIKIGKDLKYCRATAKSIILKSENDSQKEVLIMFPDKGTVTIGNRHYRGHNTVILFTTLRKVLAALSAKATCSGVQADQFSTRGYKKRTIFGFDFGPKIVELDSLSNGPLSEDRVYVLDIVTRKESYF